MTDKKMYMLTTISYFNKQKALMQKLLLLLLASLAANIIWAQDAAKEAAPVAKDVFYDSTVAYVLITVIGLLAMVIFMLGNVFILAIKNKIEQEKQSGASKAAVLTGLFILISAGSLLNLPMFLQELKQ